MAVVCSSLADGAGLGLTLGTGANLILYAMGRDKLGAVRLMAVNSVRSLHLKLPGQVLPHELSAEKNADLVFLSRDALAATAGRPQSLIGE